VTVSDEIPAWVKDGAAVLYYPHQASNRSYRGVVDGRPRKLGGTWVVALRDMGDGYRNGERAHVPAAAIDNLRPIVDNTAALGAIFGLR
jgi:hypothetical protein